MTEETLKPVAWRYEIKYGPDGEANYAWLYRGDEMVATMRTHHAVYLSSAPSALAEKDKRIAELERERDEAAGTLRYCEKQWSDERGVMIDKFVYERNRAEAAEARIAELEATIKARENGLRVQVENHNCALRRIAELEKEKHAALTMIAMLEKRLADAENKPVGTDAVGIMRQAIKRAENSCKAEGGYMPALATLVRILADELADAYPDDTNGGRAALKEMGE